MTKEHTITLSNGVTMPKLGLGVFQVDNAATASLVKNAIACGYRLIDTAQAYYNEAGVGDAIASCKVPRDQLFITTKVWISNAGEQAALRSIEESLRKLQTDYIDLLLIHQAYGDVFGTYRALEQALQQGKVRAIGLSNFLGGRFVDMAEHFSIKPHILQVETNLYCQQQATRELIAPYGTHLMAWGPLSHGAQALLSDPVVTEIAAAHGATAAQVALSFLTSHGMVAIPKSSHVERMEENLRALELVLSTDEMATLRSLDGKQAPAVRDFNDPQLAKFLLGYDAQFNPER